MSNIVSETSDVALREDEEDLRAFVERAQDRVLSYDEFLAQLETDGIDGFETDIIGHSRDASHE